MVDTESYWSARQAENRSSKLGAPPPSPPMLLDDVGEKTFGGNPNCFCKRCTKLNSVKKKSKFADYARINPMTTKELTAHQYFLCDRSVYAFIMKVRTWHTLDVGYFSEAKFDQDLVDGLVLEEDARNLVKSLSTKYAREDINGSPIDQWSADFVQGKGEGMIFLLHGKPGVGKTYTAECIAEYTRRPLLSLTCTDIGTNPLQIESKLTYWFKLAKHWGAILLIDEADIYMEHRVTRDLERNNLVAGFLRAMEYYQGILFLTTNRVGTFDDAFISRIHVSIHYPEFSERDRGEVWLSFIKKLEKEKGDKLVVTDSAKKYIETSAELKAVKWNGREIRNGKKRKRALPNFHRTLHSKKKEMHTNRVYIIAFQTAVSLAEVSAKPASETDPRVILTDKHIKQIVRMSSAFKKYLHTLHQGDETIRAAREGLRVDDFEEAAAMDERNFAAYV